MQYRRSLGLWSLAALCLLAVACSGRAPQIGAAPEEEQLFRRLSAALRSEADQTIAVNPLAVAKQFRSIINDSRVPSLRAAEIQYAVITRNAKHIVNAEQFRHKLAEEVFRNDPVAFLLAVGYSNLVDLSSPIERAIYEDLVDKMSVLARRSQSGFTATYKEKAEIADILIESLNRPGMTEQKALLIFRVALNDVFGKTSLGNPQVQMVLRLVFFQKSAKPGEAAKKETGMDARVLQDIAFVETLALLEAKGWQDKAAIMRLLAHYFGSLGRAITFVLDHGWGAQTGKNIDDIHKIGLLLSEFDLATILRAFGESRWAEPGFDPANADSYSGANALALELLFPVESPQRALAFPIENIGLAHPTSVRPTALLFAQLKALLGTWEDVARAVQIANRGLEPHLVASLVYLSGPDSGWGQLLIDAGVGLTQIVNGAAAVFGKGEGLSKFLASTPWAKLPPVQQIAKLAAAAADDCIAGFELLAPALGAELEANPEGNRRYIAKGWDQLTPAEACGRSGGGRQLFMEVFMVKWSGGSPLNAVKLLSQAMDVDRDATFKLLSKSKFAGLSEAEFTRAYVSEDIDARRQALERRNQASQQDLDMPIPLP